MPTLTICGGGNAAHTLIPLAIHAGWEVNLLTLLPDEAARLQAGIEAADGLTARFADHILVGHPRQITTDPAQVIPTADLVLLALPAFAHGPVLQAIAGYLSHAAMVGALPARGGFDLQARAILGDRAGDVMLFGLQTLPWACRIATYGQQVDILGVKAAVDMAAAPPNAAPRVAHRLAALLQVNLTPIASFLTLTLANTGQLIHPGIMYGLCRGQEQKTFTADEIPLFYQGVDPQTADLLQAMSDEVQAVAAALGNRLPRFDPRQVAPLYHWLTRAYPTQIADAGTLQRAFVTNRAYTGLKVPVRQVEPGRFAVDFQARYLSEDVPFGLVVTRGIAELVGAATPAIDKVILWAQERLGRQYLVDGALRGPDVARTRAPQVYGIDTLEKLLATYQT